MSKLAHKIGDMLDSGMTQANIAAACGCSESYVRAIKSGWRGFGIRTRDYSFKEPEGHRNPIIPNNVERAIRLRRAGFSPWEIGQMIPHGGFDAQPHT